MKENKICRLMPVFLVLVLCFSLFQPAASYAQNKLNGQSIKEAVQLTNGKELKSSFDKPEQVRWYKITPAKDEISKDTHMRIKLSSNAELNLSIYPSSEKANKDDTFDMYRGFTVPGQPAQIVVPYAWSGPYYIKVEYSDSEEKGDGEATPGKAEYKIGYQGVKLPPSSQVNEPCPVELSTDQRKSGTDILNKLRLIRDHLLSKTDNGKNLTSLYYKTAPFLVAKMIVNKDTKESVYKNLLELKPLFDDLAENGSNSSHEISRSDQKAINNLYDITVKAVPNALKDKITGIAQEIDLAHLEGKPLSDVLKKAGLSNSDSTASSVSNKYIVKLKEGKSIKSVNNKMSAYGDKATAPKSLKPNGQLFNNMYVMKIGSHQLSKSPQEKITVNRLKKMPEVDFVEPVKRYHNMSNDVQYDYQWPLKNSGQEGGKRGADIKNEPMKSLLKKRQLKEPLIAVVDTGVDSTLADLKQKVRTDLGKNFIARNNNTNDDEGHGTHVAGIIAAASDNGYSMSGLDPKVKIMPVKVLDESGSGETDQIAMGIKYAVDKGAKVINLSLGGDYSRVIEYALKYAASKNVTVVAASGNDGINEVGYPASSRYTIAVGATNRLDITADYSNYGKDLDLVAPGTDIPSLLPNGNVTYLSGTSMATPYVTAAAGVLLSENPKLKPDEIKNILTETADNVAFKEVDNTDEDYDDDGNPQAEAKTPGFDKVSGWGRLNAYSAASVADLNVKVNDIKDNMDHITGSAKKGTLIQVKKGSKTLGKSTASSKGTFTVKIPVQKAGQLVHINASDKNGLAKASIKIAVKKGKAPASPKVNSVSNKDTTVTGKTLANIKVNVKNSSKKVMASAKSNSKGTFKVKIKKQKAGTILYVTVTDLAKRESKPVKITVKDKIPPAAPKVNTVYDKEKLIQGKTESKAAISVKSKGKTIGETKANTKGTFKAAIQKQKAGSVLYVTAKDKAGNTSKPAKVTVKKSKKK
ncbi:S8 family peptidase [Scopulibacillus cellulosilyticus]|uniref:S8 family serine peptidase n=1 Tax=Scopulibacillus cellulosilyticus TaxID=2665665 RepID=A0ABW2PUX5_9BACL